MRAKTKYIIKVKQYNNSFHYFSEHEKFILKIKNTHWLINIDTYEVEH